MLVEDPKIEPNTENWHCKRAQALQRQEFNPTKAILIRNARVEEKPLKMEDPEDKEEDLKELKDAKDDDDVDDDDDSYKGLPDDDDYKKKITGAADEAFERWLADTAARNLARASEPEIVKPEPVEEEKPEEPEVKPLVISKPTKETYVLPPLPPPPELPKRLANRYSSHYLKGPTIRPLGSEPLTPPGSRRDSFRGVFSGHSLHSMTTGGLWDGHRRTGSYGYTGVTMDQVATHLQAHLEAIGEPDPYDNSIFNPCCCMKLEKAARRFIKFDLLGTITFFLAYAVGYFTDVRIEFSYLVMGLAMMAFFSIYTDIYILVGPVHLRFSRTVYWLLMCTTRHLCVPSVWAYFQKEEMLKDPKFMAFCLGSVVCQFTLGTYAVLVIGSYARILYHRRKIYLREKKEEDYKAARNNPLVRVESIQVPGPSVRKWKPPPPAGGGQPAPARTRSKTSMKGNSRPQ